MVKRKDALRALLSGAPPADTRPSDDDLTAQDMPLTGSDDEGNETPTRDEPRHSGHARSGAVNAMRASWGEMQRQADAARTLREEVASGGHVVLVDADKILPSPVADRLSRAGDLDPGFEALKASIAADGQSVPVLIRPHSDAAKAADGFYQTAYGHRRVQAARDLGLKVKAIVRPLSDDELVLAQGRENAERRDLSFIERAFFAKGLEGRNFSRETIRAALGIDNSELTRLLQVAHRIPRPVAKAVGPAPKVGRPRWGELGEEMEKPGAHEFAIAFTASPEFRALGDSGERFRALQRHMERGRRGPEKAAEETITTRKGLAIATIKLGPRTRPQLTFASTDAEGFSRFVAGQLVELYASFQAAEGESGTETGLPDPTASRRRR